MADRGNKSSAAAGPFTALRGKGGVGMAGAAKGIALGGSLGWSTAGMTFGRVMQVGAIRDDTEGNPGTPSLKLTYPGFWRFRWVVRAGSRSIQVNVKQADNRSPYPSLIVKANSDVGVSSDLTTTSTGGAGWVVVGPLTFTATATGLLWVELWNNTTYEPAPCFFDHIVIV